MSVEPLKVGKSFIRIDKKKPIKPINKESKESKIIENKYYYEKPNNGNVNINDLFTMLINKIDSIGNSRDIYGEVKNNMEAVEVDIKKDLFIENIKTSKLESEEIKGKVKTKKDKLKALRRRNKK